MGFFSVYLSPSCLASSSRKESSIQVKLYEENRFSNCLPGLTLIINFAQSNPPPRGCGTKNYYSQAGYSPQPIRRAEHYTCTFMKARLQLLSVDHDGILRMDLVIHRRRKGSTPNEGRAKGRTSTNGGRKRKESIPIHFSTYKL